MSYHRTLKLVQSYILRLFLSSSLLSTFFCLQPLGSRCSIFLCDLGSAPYNLACTVSCTLTPCYPPASFRAGWYSIRLPDLFAVTPPPHRPLMLITYPHSSFPLLFSSFLLLLVRFNSLPPLLTQLRDFPVYLPQLVTDFTTFVPVAVAVLDVFLPFSPFRDSTPNRPPSPCPSRVCRPLLFSPPTPSPCFDIAFMQLMQEPGLLPSYCEGTCPSVAPNHFLRVANFVCFPQLQKCGSPPLHILLQYFATGPEF